VRLDAAGAGRESRFSRPGRGTATRWRPESPTQMSCLAAFIKHLLYAWSMLGLLLLSRLILPHAPLRNPFRTVLIPQAGKSGRCRFCSEPCQGLLLLQAPWLPGERTSALANVSSKTGFFRPNPEPTRCHQRWGGACGQRIGCHKAGAPPGPLQMLLASTGCQDLNQGVQFGDKGTALGTNTRGHCQPGRQAAEARPTKGLKKELRAGAVNGLRCTYHRCPGDGPLTERSAGPLSGPAGHVTHQMVMCCLGHL
jgi:hypothetical protein